MIIFLLPFEEQAWRSNLFQVWEWVSKSNAGPGHAVIVPADWMSYAFDLH
jgi:hypothetical protein